MKINFSNTGLFGLIIVNLFIFLLLSSLNLVPSSSINDKLSPKFDKNIFFEKSVGWRERYE